MPAAARQTDSVSTGHPCDAVTTLAAPGQSTVFIEGLLACRLGDSTEVHTILVGDICVPHTETIKSSSDSVYISGALAARLGDACDAGSITSGASSVFIG